jgi:hypothetical protein
MKTTIEMAREAQLPYFYQTGEIANLKQLEVFAELVRADEREACAAKAGQVGQHKNHIGIAAAIRARGEKS